MKAIYESSIVAVGDLAHRFLEDNMMLLFSEESVMSEVKRYSLLIKPSTLDGNIEKGDLLVIGDHEIDILKVGNVVNQNLHDISHITIRFEVPMGNTFPGTLYCEPTKFKEINVGDVIKVIKRGSI